jgi:hypothetical protein
MKKTLPYILVLLSATGIFSSCESGPGIQSQPAPPMEEEWGKTLSQWYPDWTAPVIVQKIEQ